MSKFVDKQTYSDMQNIKLKFNFQVNAKNSWNDFWPHFKLPTCVNGSVALKQIYLR